MKLKVYPYKNGSASASALATSIGCKVLKREGKDVKTGGIINWGSSVVQRNCASEYFLNLPENVKRASNKLTTFNYLSQYVDEFSPLKLPEYTTTPDEEFISSSLAAGGIVIRHVLSGHSGNGIVIADKVEDLPLPKAPLYVKYIKRKDEYRVHVFNSNVFFVQRKARKLDVPDEQVNWKIRNLSGGFIYASEGVTLPKEILDACGRLITLTGLDFGAIDLLYSSSKEYYFLEINTAPGLSGTTLEKYSEQFSQFFANT